MTLRLQLPEEDLARVERLRAAVSPIVTKRTALALRLLQLGLEVAERTPGRLVPPREQTGETTR